MIEIRFQVNIFLKLYEFHTLYICIQGVRGNFDHCFSYKIEKKLFFLIYIYINYKIVQYI